MSISFSLIPANLRVPGTFVEFDNSRALTGLPGLPYRILVIAQRLSSGTKPAGQLDLVTSADQAKTYYGAGSMAWAMVEKIKRNNRFTPVYVMALDDAGAGAAAGGNILFGGTATSAGTVPLWVSGRRVPVGVASGDTATDVAAAVVAAIQANADLPLSAAVNGSDDMQADLTAKHKGEAGNSIDVRVNYQVGEELPPGITATVTPMAGGTTNPDLAAAIAALGDEWFQVIANPYTDATSLTALENELADRFGPIRAIEGHAFAAATDTVGNLTTLGGSRNSPHSTILGLKGSPTPPYEIAAAVAGVVGEHGQRDPARPFQTLELRDVLAPVEADRFTLDERNTLLFTGIATASVDAGGRVRIERLITTYQETPAGTPDASYLDVNTLLTLGYLRFTLRSRFASKFPQHKLADSGTRFGPGQAVLTPLIAKGELFALFREWETAGLVENFDQFKEDLLVQRSEGDPNRLEILVPPDLINQLRVVAAQIQFRL